MREVAVVGVGMSPFGRYPDRSIVDHGVAATREALADAGLTWPKVELAYCAAGNVGLFPGSRIGHALGLTGAPIINIENASASGSSAFREAYFAVAEGRCDIALAVGVGKMGRVMFSGVGPDEDERRKERARGPVPPAGIFAMRARRRMQLHGATNEMFAAVAVKNRKHAAMNPYAQFQTETSLEEVLASRVIADPLRLLECCPTGDGGAAAIVATADVARRTGARGPVHVAASAFRSELFSTDPFVEALLTKATVADAYEAASLGPDDLSLVQVHDAFASEEIEYYEALGLCGDGLGDRLALDGETSIGGRIPVNTDGGLIARGHPIGPTGLAQIWETVLQLRGDAGARQVQGARVGLAHMIGAGSVCLIHVLVR